jgi:hypothetical protein
MFGRKRFEVQVGWTAQLYVLSGDGPVLRGRNPF